MKCIKLNGQWEMRNVNWKDWIDAGVPGSVALDLLNAGKVADPYYRDNEDAVASLFQEDYEYLREFTVSESVLQHDRVLLCCEGLDTIAMISLNGSSLASTNNMHRTYRFDVKDRLQAGTNQIHIRFFSPVKCAEKLASENKENSLPSKGIEHIRKAQCMFGWDWGPALPDSGIWRNIYLECFDEGKIEDVFIRQEHHDGRVALVIKSTCEIWCASALEIEAKVTSPEGGTVSAVGQISASNDECTVTIEISEPRLWWPNGFGKQPLYQVEVSLSDHGKLLDSRCLQIGLRTIQLRQEEDKWGRSYEFIVNGKALFMKGACLIIEDAVLGRCSPEKTEKLIKACVSSNFNCIRVWGGSFYPSDEFYGLCDQYGLIIYHDLMFACKFYPADKDFLENVKREVTDNVKRARNHACIGLWCGNNETEVIFGTYVSKDPSVSALRKQMGISDIEEDTQRKLKKNYLRLFYEMLPELMTSLAPDTCFVNSSPCCDEPCSGTFLTGYNRGDAHYYFAADMLAPYSKIRGLNFRFVSEIGFQSYPSIKTIRMFTLPEDRRPDSAVMLKHQKYPYGNPIIEKYMARDYKIPGDFEHYVYVSQMMAGEIVKYTVEHLRRNEKRSMGCLVWQLNDCWPVISWAGIDYGGRWKAQQYYLKRSFEPILITALEDGAAMDIFVVNDTPEDVQGVVTWSLRNNYSEVIEQGEKEINADSCKSQKAVHLDFNNTIVESNQRDYYVEFSFAIRGRISSRGTVLFVKPKDFNFIDPGIKLDIEETETSFAITVNANRFAKSVALDLSLDDCTFSDNYFDISAGDSRKITVLKSNISKRLTADDFRRQIQVTSVYDTQVTK